MRASSFLVPWAALPLALAAVAGCNGSTQADPTMPGGPPPAGASAGVQGPDRSLCEWQNEPDVEVSETAGPGAIQPNVRRVYRVFGEGRDRRKVLACREIDTNLDGYKDVVRFYNDEGQSKEERADTNFDGKIDTWNVFAKGRLAEVRHDRNHDGEPDEWKIYVKGELSRVKRDSDFDGQPDIWEMYSKGRLERMGVDLDGDERVDRWDHDVAFRKRLEEEERKKREAEEKKRRERMEELREEGLEAAEEMEGG